MGDEERTSAKQRSDAIKRGMQQTRKRLGRPSKASYRTLARIAELAEADSDSPPRSLPVVAAQLNAEGVRTLSGTGEWTADRVKYAKRSARYRKFLEAREDEGFGLPPLTWDRYLAGNRLVVGRLGTVAVLVPLGYRRSFDSRISRYVRRALQAGKVAVLIGPEEPILRARPTWQQYQRFAVALQEVGVAEIGEFVRVEGLDVLNELPQYVGRLNTAITCREPMLRVELNPDLATALFIRTLDRLNKGDDRELQRGIMTLGALCGSSVYAWLWRAARNS